MLDVLVLSIHPKEYRIVDTLPLNFLSFNVNFYNFGKI